MVIFTIFVILLFDVNTGNVICLPKSGSTFVNALLGKHSLHEYDHQGISNLAIEMSSMPSEAIALYYLSTRREYISNYVDISTTMIFLIDYFSKTDYSLPTLFILRNPRDWCRSILSYSLDVARAGEYHDWVQNYQSLFTGGVHISARDLANDTSLALKINALLPGLFRCWHNSHSRLASNIHKFGNLYMLNTNNLSIIAATSVSYSRLITNRLILTIQLLSTARQNRISSGKCVIVISKIYRMRLVQSIMILCLHI